MDTTTDNDTSTELLSDTGSTPEYLRLKEMDEKVNRVWADNEAWRKENRRSDSEDGRSAEQEAEWKRRNAHLDDLLDEREMIHKKRRAEHALSDVREEAHAKQAHAMGSVNKAEKSRDLFLRWIVGGDQVRFDFSADEQKLWQQMQRPDDEFKKWAQKWAITAGSGSAGQHIPTTLDDQITEYQREMAEVPMWVGSTVTETGGPHDVPVFDDTDHEGRWLGEAADATTGAEDPDFTKVPVPVHIASSDFLRLSYESIEDYAPDMLEDVIVRNLGGRLGTLTGKGFTNGTGSANNQPVGYLTGSATTAYDVTYDTSDGTFNTAGIRQLLAAPEQVRTPYLRDAVWTFSRTALAAIRGIGTTENMPIFLPGNIAGGEPSTILGYPYFSNSWITGNPATDDAVWGTFGSMMRGYTVRTTMMGRRMLRSEHIYIRTRELGVGAFERCGGNIVDSDAYVRLVANVVA